MTDIDSRAVAQWLANRRASGLAPATVLKLKMILSRSFELDAGLERVDVERRRWLIPRTRTGKARRVPLSSAALATIAAAPRFEGCPWLVPNPETLQPFVSIKHAWQAAREAAGLPSLRLHDLRHAFASFAVNAGVDLYTVGKLLGHNAIQSTQRYAALNADTLLAAVEAGAAKLDAAR